MLFDKLCYFEEKFNLGLRNILDEAKIFVFDKAAHEIVKPGDSKQHDFLLFTLPYKVTCVEDLNSCSILLDTEDNQVGVSGVRHIIEITDMLASKGFSSDEDTLDHQSIIKTMINKGVSNMYFITYSIIQECIPGDRGLQIACTNKWMSYIKNDVHEHIEDYDSPTMQNIIKSCATNAVATIEEIISIYTKKNFVLESRPLKERKAPKKIVRSTERPLYTILDARSIRKKLQLTGGYDKAVADMEKRKSPIPHERRRHLRRLSVESGYKENRTIVIPATWIGPSEAIVGNKRYRVVLDV